MSVFSWQNFIDFILQQSLYTLTLYYNLYDRYFVYIQYFNINLLFYFQKLSDSTSLIGPTCDTFIATLEECMKLVSNTPMFESAHQRVRDAAIPASPSRANTQRLPVSVLFFNFFMHQFLSSFPNITMFTIFYTFE